MADSYWIDIIPSRLKVSAGLGKPKSNVGSDDYYIRGNVGDTNIRGDIYQGNVGGPPRGRVDQHRQWSHRAHGGYGPDYWQGYPVYVVPNEEVISTEDNSEVGAWPGWVQEQINRVHDDKAGWVNFMMNAIVWARKNPKNPLAAKIRETQGVAMRPLDPWWQATAERKKLHDYFFTHDGGLRFHTSFTPLKVVGDIVHTVNAAAGAAGKALSSIPVAGGIIHTTLGIVTTGPAMLGKLASGARIDHVLLDSLKREVANIKAVAPYVQTIMSMVPGIGTGVSAALAAGVALSEGRTITQAVMDAAKAAVPGGPIGQAAFATATQLASGKGIKDAALSAARAAIPAGPAQKAFDIGVAMGHARSIQSAIVAGVTSSGAISKLGNIGAGLIKASPVLMAASKGLSSDAAKGFKVASGVLSHKGVNAHALMALRAKLPPAQQPGFDHAARAIVSAHNPHWPSLVSNGIVLRGEWKACRPNAKGCTKGRLVQNGKVTEGTFTRA